MDSVRRLNSGMAASNYYYVCEMFHVELYGIITIISTVMLIRYFPMHILLNI